MTTWNISGIRPEGSRTMNLNMTRRYFTMRDMGKLTARLNILSCHLRYAEDDGEVVRFRRNMCRCHCFNEKGAGHFLGITCGRFQAEYILIKELCENMKTVEDAIMAADICDKLVKKLEAEVPWYCKGLVIHTDSDLMLYITLADLMSAVILAEALVLLRCYILPFFNAALQAGTWIITGI